MSTRFPPLELESDLGSALESTITEVFGPNAGFQWKDSKGAPIGPFAVLAYTPDIFPQYLTLAGAVMQQETVEPRRRELVFLAVTAVYDVPFIRYAHERVSVKVGLSEDQVAAAVEGRTPEGLSDTEMVTYETALKLARARGPLDGESWQVVETQLGKEGAARVGQIVAWLVYNCTLLNLGAVQVSSE